MGNDISSSLRPALVILLLMTLLTGIVYPLAITGVGQSLLAHQANGSLVRDGDTIVGSALIGQNFAGPTYFHPRPSAAGDGYDAAASSGSNLGPTSDALKTSITERVAAARADGAGARVPADMVTASGSGLDPAISPANAFAQAKRVAAARGVREAALRTLIGKATTAPTLGILGEAHVNVLLLNRQLDQMAAQAPR